MTSNIKGEIRKLMVYAMPGSSASYPMFNLSEQRMIDSGSKSKKKVLKGQGKKVDQSKVENQVINAIENVLKSDNPVMEGGVIDIQKIDFNKIKKQVTPILKTAASVGLDIGAPALGAAISTAFSGNPAIGALVAKLAREALRVKTGVGRKSDVGVYKGGSKGKKYPRTECKVAPKNVSKKRTDRNELAANKYIKEHNLY
jgi:hypothetical protein